MDFDAIERITHRRLDSETLRRARAQLEQEHNSRQDPNAKLNGLNNKAPPIDLFIPVGKADLVFLSLRLKIFQLNQVSATPIANIIRHHLSDAEVFRMIDSCVPSDNVGYSLVPQDWKTPGRMRLRDAMDKARDEHAVRLRDHSMRDVEILYSCSHPAIEAMKDDQMQIEKVGGKAYHLWPFDPAKKRMGMSVLLSQDTLHSIYSEERRTRFEISYSDNTRPAPFEPSLAAKKPKLLMYMSGARVRESHVPDDNSEAVKRILGQSLGCSAERLQQHLRDPRAAVKDDSPSSVRYKAVPASIATPSPPEDHPSCDLDNHWWQRDVKARDALMDEWKRSSWDPETQNYRKGDRVQLPGIYGDELCTTYVSNRNYTWWDENLRGEEELERTQGELLHLKTLYAQLHKQTEKMRMQTLVPHNQQVKQGYKDALENERTLAAQVRTVQQKALKLQAESEERRTRPKTFRKCNTDEEAKERARRRHVAGSELGKSLVTETLGSGRRGPLMPQPGMLGDALRDAVQSEKWSVAKAPAVAKQGIFHVLKVNARTEPSDSPSHDPTLPALVPLRGAFWKLTGLFKPATQRVNKRATSLPTHQHDGEAMRDTRVAQAESMVADDTTTLRNPLTATCQKPVGRVVPFPTLLTSPVPDDWSGTTGEEPEMVEVHTPQAGVKNRFLALKEEASG